MLAQAQPRWHQPPQAALAGREVRFTYTGLEHRRARDRWDPGAPTPPPSSKHQHVGGSDPPPSSKHQHVGGSDPLPNQLACSELHPPPCERHLSAPARRGADSSRAARRRRMCREGRRVCKGQPALGVWTPRPASRRGSTPEPERTCTCMHRAQYPRRWSHVWI